MSHYNPGCQSLTSILRVTWIKVRGRGSPFLLYLMMQVIHVRTVLLDTLSMEIWTLFTVRMHQKNIDLNSTNCELSPQNDNLLFAILLSGIWYIITLTHHIRPVFHVPGNKIEISIYWHCQKGIFLYYVIFVSMSLPYIWPMWLEYCHCLLHKYL